MTFWHRGSVEAVVENIKLVEGTPQDSFGGSFGGKARWKSGKIRFSTGAEFADDKKTVRITFKNNGSQPVSLDDIAVVK